MSQPLLKLCGNHSLNDVEVSFGSSADYVGFVFAKSKRQVTRGQIAEWLQQHEPTKKKLVALFVNASTDEIVEAVSSLPISIIQCHGNESPSQISEIKKRLNIPVWKVIHHSEDGRYVMQSYENIADGYIVDCKVGKQWGGTGVSFDWTSVPTYMQEGQRQNVPVFIAGGIRPENIADLLVYQPDGIDVSSGIEENGLKSRKLVRELEERMRNNATR